jgi:hypothetical protein
MRTSNTDDPIIRPDLLFIPVPVRLHPSILSFCNVAQEHHNGAIQAYFLEKYIIGL